MTRPEQRPEGALIQRALDRLDLSVRDAAKRVEDISDTRLRHIITGREPLGGGRYRPITAKPAQLARIAHALEITPEELVAAERGDAATVLCERLRAPRRVAEVPGDVGLPAQLEWIRQQPWSWMEKQQVASLLLQIAAEAQREQRAAG
jgi:hypothetical protein